jgi:CubicO group peptidase (beta-lactamase class C family)
MKKRIASTAPLESTADAASAGLSMNRVKELLNWITEKTQDRSYGCIILRAGRMGVEQYGGGFAADSLFEIGSIRKSFNSALIGNGLKEGRINMDLIAGDIWPDLSDISGDSADENITVHQLVSGISGWLTDDSPGTTFRYNNAGFTAAEKVVARLYGFVNDEIAPEIEKRFKGVLNARSWRVYHFSNPFDPLDIDNPGPKLAIDSTLRDLIKWGLLWLNNGIWDGKERIPSEYVKLATGLVNPQIANARYGYNWFVNAGKMLWPLAPADSYGHAGFGTFKPSERDSRAFLWICPSLNMVAAVVADIEVGFANDFLEVPMALTAEWIARVVATAEL